MKQQINEIKRMQQLAGLIKEGMSIGAQGNLQVDYELKSLNEIKVEPDIPSYKFKIGQTVKSYGNEITHKILDTRPNWEEVEEDPNDPEFIMRGTENSLDDENMPSPWYLVEPVNTEEDGDYMFWWPEDELKLI